MPRTRKLPVVDPVPAPAPEEMWRVAVHAAEAKQGKDILVLDLRAISAFADYFVLISGSNTRQIQAIADEVELQIRKAGDRALSVEGYDNAEWILMDYGDYLIHIFSEKARAYYDLERLWREAKVVEL